jgi:hypothetical protein
MVARIRGVMVAAALVTALTGKVHAQLSTILDPSIRSAAMGGACSAVTWGDITNDWANPALLGYRSGVRYEWGTTQLLPGFASDIHFITNRVVLGYGGIGLVSAGEPFDVGGSKVDYGRSEATDEQGNFIGTFDSYEKTRSWGVGVSLSRGVGALIGDAALPSLLRVFDVAVGYNQKKVEASLFPPTVDEVTTGKDVGVLARFSPRVVPLSVSYGYSIINADDATHTLGFGLARTSSIFPAVPNLRTYRNGVAARGVGNIPGIPKRMLGGLLDASLSLGAALDWEKLQDGNDAASAYHLQQMGFELEALRAIAIRVGQSKNLAGVFTSYGFGLGLDWHGVVGARYDYAIYSQPYNQPDLHRQGVSAFVDPVNLIRGTP